MGSNNGMALKLDLNSGEFIVPKKTAASDSPAPVVGGDASLKLSKLNYFLHALEEESRKIDAFKRELPFSMLIITHAIEKVKEEVLRMKGKSSDDDYVRFRPGEIKKESGAFHPYKRIRAAEEEAELVRYDGGGGGASSVEVRRLKSKTGRGVKNVLLPQGKKHRRCWSPELHRRFVDALHQLGGAHAATPKRIIDIMRVDGLTNDEVKSHLQKYRLHVGRLSIGLSLPGPMDLKGTQLESPRGPPQTSAREISMATSHFEDDVISECSCEIKL